MIKIFSMLSVVFALLAGFSACGTAYSENDEDKTETYDESMYGAIYSSYAIISGTVKNEAGEGLESILVEEYDCYYYRNNCDERGVHTDKKGGFALTFNEEEAFSTPSSIRLFFTDKSNSYVDKETRISTSCNEISEKYYECKNEKIEVIMTKKPVENEIDDEQED